MEVKRKKGKPLITDYEYLKNNRYFAQIEEGIKDIGAKELAELGAKKIKPTFRGIYFTADRKTLYRINYTSRLISRVLAPLVSFECPDTDTLYRIAKTYGFSVDELCRLNDISPDDVGDIQPGRRLLVSSKD